MSQRTERAYDRWAPTYDQDPNPQTSLEEADVLQLLRLPRQCRILDAACGTGRYIGRMVQNGCRVTGFDVSSGMLEVARASHPDVALVRADMASPLVYRSESFSHVLCAQALKHVPNLRDAMTELARVLQPGGRLVFSVTHPGMDFTDYELSFEPSFILSREADIHHHSEHDYRNCLEDAGFVVEEWRAIPVSTTIEHLLTPASFQKVRGRRQVLAVSAVRGAP